MAIEYLHLLLIGTSLIANALLALFVLSKKFKSLASLYYFLFMCAVVVHVTGDLFFQLSTTVREALFWIYVYWIGFFFLAIFFFYFATVFPKQKKLFFTNEPAKLILMIIPVGLVYILIYSGEFIKEIIFSSTQVHSVAYGNLYWVGTSYLALFLWFGLFKLFIDYRQTIFESEKKNIQLVFIGIFIGAVLGLLGDVFLIKLLGFGELKLASVFILFSCIVMSYVVVRHKIFTIIPANEKASTTKPIITVEPGKSYFVDEKSIGRKKAFRLFSDIVRHNHQGLAVSTDHPNQIRQKYLLEKTPIIWLSDSVEQKKGNIKIDELEALNSTIYSFLDRAINPVVLIDGIKMMLIVNGSRKTTDFFKSIIKKTKETNSIIFFSVGGGEKEFVDTFNETIAITKTINELEKKLLSRKISDQTHDELLVETWEELIEKEATMKIIEEELIGKIINSTKIERALAIEKKALSFAQYYIAKRKFGSTIGGQILNDINKKIVRFENELRKNRNRY